MIVDKRPPRPPFRRPFRARLAFGLHRHLEVQGGFDQGWRHQSVAEAFDNHLEELGFQAWKDQIVDASIVPASRQRNSREENEAIKAGTPPSEWSEWGWVVE